MEIVVAGEGPYIDGAADLKRLAVRAASVTDLTRLGVLGTATDDGSHAWLQVEELRAAAGATVPDADRAAWISGYDGMIAYASEKGWLNEAGTHVRAHVELTG